MIVYREYVASGTILDGFKLGGKIDLVRAPDGGGVLKFRSDECLVG